MEEKFEARDLIGILGILWALPLCVLAWLFLIVMILAGQIESVKLGPYLTLIVDLKNDARFCRKQMTAKGWAGYGWGNVAFVVDTDTERWYRTIWHEQAHNYQQYVFGVFQPILYFLASIFIWVFIRRCHSYYDNPFERHAREQAGQRVDIPRSQWSAGPKDRWAWW